MVIIEPAVLVKITFAEPLILIELSVIVGTLVIVPTAVRLMTMSSLATGIAAPDQFAGVVQDPPPVSCQVFMAPEDTLLNKVRNININAHL